MTATPHTAQQSAFAPPTTSAPGIAPLGIAIPAQADTFAYAPGITPWGLTIPPLLQALTFYAPVPPFQLTMST
jgi:hypothetical protein